MVQIRMLGSYFLWGLYFLELFLPCHNWDLLFMVAERLSFCKKTNFLCGFGSDDLKKYSIHVDK